jgi:hypothetical protein
MRMSSRSAVLGAGFLVAVGDPREDFGSADQLAAFAGLRSSPHSRAFYDRKPTS